MLALLLALGLCTSVLVAWAGALVDRSAWPDTLLTGAPEGTRTELRGWLVEMGRDPTLTWRTFKALDLWDQPPDLEAPTELPAWSVGHDLPDQPGPFAPARERTRDVAWEVSAGWPMRCVRAVRSAGPSEFALPGEFVRGGVAAMAVAWPMAHGRVTGHEGLTIEPWPNGGLAAVVPLRPIIGGLVVNTVVLALGWGVALSPLVALRAARRWRRGRKNRCARCGHARDGLPTGAPCAECGRDPHERTTLNELLTARAPMCGAVLALALVLASSAALLTHRWMAVDRLPPLHHAAAVGDVERIEQLLASGASVDAPLGALGGVPESVHATTPPAWAVARGHDVAVDALLDALAAPDVAGAREAILHMAMVAGHDDLAERHMRALDPGGPPRLVAIGFSSASDRVRAAALKHFDWSLDALNEAAWAAIESQDVACLQRLVDAGLARPALDRRNLLYIAVMVDGMAWRRPYRHDPGLTLLVMELGLEKRGEARGRALGAAVSWGSLPAIETLIESLPGALAAPGLLHENDLARAASIGGAPVIERLAAAGVDLNTSSSGHVNALWYAAVGGEVEAVEVLLRFGVDPTFGPGSRPLRYRLIEVRDEALARDPPRSYPPFRERAADYERILDLLEAAEAEWNAREQDPAPPGPP